MTNEVTPQSHRSHTTSPSAIRFPTAKLQPRYGTLCAKCGPYGKGKKHRHHVEIQRCMLPWVPEWKPIYRKFRGEDIVQLCNYCHNIVHDGLYAEHMSEWWHAAYYGYRDEDLAREVASACSTAFWNWLEEDSYARRTRQLRWHPDPAFRDGPLLRISSNSKGTL